MRDTRLRAFCLLPPEKKVKRQGHLPGDFPKKHNLFDPGSVGIE